MRLKKLYICIKKEKFYWLKFILEGYDGLAVLSNDDREKKTVIIRYPDMMEKDVFRLLNSLAPELNPWISS